MSGFGAEPETTCGISPIITVLWVSSHGLGRRGFANRLVVSRDASLTIVMQYASRRWPFDARDGTEVFVDGSDVPPSHTLKGVPRHDLQQVAVEWRRKAVCSLAGRTGRMQVIEVHSSPEDLLKFRE